MEKMEKIKKKKKAQFTVRMWRLDYNPEHGEKKKENLISDENWEVHWEKFEAFLKRLLLLVLMWGNWREVMHNAAIIVSCILITSKRIIMWDCTYIVFTT